jgi:glutamate-1-semialdehyde 2,1-aminomutase
LKFEGGYHGMNDYALMSNHSTLHPADFPKPVPNSAGIPQRITDDVLIAPFNDLERTVDIIRKYSDELGGVIVEPLCRTILPVPGFLEGLRELTRELDIPLIFDEVVTGFRLALGGAQECYGVTPDLCATGKVISCGHPLGVVCGRADIMDHAGPATAGTPDHVSLTGTYSSNPISAKVALAVIGEASAFQPWFTKEEVTDHRASLSADVEMNSRFTNLLLDRGIAKGHEKFFISTVHPDEDIDYTIHAIREVVGLLA